ncbi:hypothetical protein LY76DRAFT_162057 [Colletotrichum caudatum]|nr:hypothetical protein LY76DRAFT_162057 [Colletotrichum caudatum]
MSAGDKTADSAVIPACAAAAGSLRAPATLTEARILEPQNLGCGRSFALHNSAVDTYLLTSGYKLSHEKQRMPAPSPRLYFAYGSNLSPTQMALRCPSSVPVGLAHLAGYTFIINSRGYANVVRSTAPGDDAPAPPTDTAGPGGYGVYGVLYTLTPADEAALDMCEGVPYAYQKHDLPATVVSTAAAAEASPALPHDGDTGPQKGASVTALVYVDGERTAPSLPRAEYVGRMNHGVDEAAELFGLPAAYVDRVVRPYIPALNSPIAGATTIEDPFHDRA